MTHKWRAWRQRKPWNYSNGWITHNRSYAIQCRHFHWGLNRHRSFYGSDYFYYIIIPTIYQLGGSGKGCGVGGYHYVEHGQAVVNWWPFGMGWEGSLDFSPQAEPLHFQIPPKILQEVNISQESQQGQKYTPCVAYQFGKSCKSPWKS